MQGLIRTREKCAHCQGRFTEGYIGKERDLVCSCGRTPRTYYIYLYHKGDRKITRDRDSKILDSYRRAHRLLERIRSEIDARTLDITEYLTTTRKQHEPRALIVAWYRHKTRQGLSPTTLREIARHIRKHFSPIAQKLGLSDCRDIRTHHIDAFLDALPVHLSQKTKSNIMVNLSSFVNWLKRKEILERSPEFPAISVPEPPRKFARKEVLLKALPFVPEHDRPLIHFMLFHPLRSGEVSALRVRDFMLDYRIAHITQAWSAGKLRHRKNKKPYYMPLSEHFDDSILRHKFPDQFVFLNSIGNPYTSNHIKKIWRSACERSGIPYIPIKNAGRTSIASAAANRGESLIAIAAALGNTPEVVASNYAHLNVDAARQVIDGTSQIRHKKKRTLK